jgi:non-heme chloroperoxidase
MAMNMLEREWRNHMKNFRFPLLLTALFVIGCAASIGVGSYAPIEKHWQNEYAKRQVTVNPGVMLKYHDVGPKTGKVIFFIHGMGDSARAWYLVGPELLNEFRLIAPDLRGHGQSEAPACCYAMNNYTADILGLMDSIKVEKAIFVGHSSGSFIARQFAIENPSRVEKLVLISSTDTGANSKELDYVAGVLQTDKGVKDQEFQKTWFAATTVLPIPDTLKSKAEHERMHTSEDVWQADLMLMRNPQDSHQLGSITIPTLILWGEQDKVFGKQDEDRLQKAMPNSRFKSYAGAGHTVQWEMPKEVAADIRAFANQ